MLNWLTSSKSSSSKRKFTWISWTSKFLARSGLVQRDQLMKKWSSLSYKRNKVPSLSVKREDTKKLTSQSCNKSQFQSQKSQSRGNRIWRRKTFLNKTTRRTQTIFSLVSTLGHKKLLEPFLIKKNQLLLSSLWTKTKSTPEIFGTHRSWVGFQNNNRQNWWSKVKMHFKNLNTSPLKITGSLWYLGSRHIDHLDSIKESPENPMQDLSLTYKKVDISPLLESLWWTTSKMNTLQLLTRLQQCGAETNKTFMEIKEIASKHTAKN